MEATNSIRNSKANFAPLTNAIIVHNNIIFYGKKSGPDVKSKYVLVESNLLNENSELGLVLVDDRKMRCFGPCVVIGDSMIVDQTVVALKV